VGRLTTQRLGLPGFLIGPFLRRVQRFWSCFPHERARELGDLQDRDVPRNSRKRWFKVCISLVFVVACKGPN
jgi:hypothetical protein